MSNAKYAERRRAEAEKKHRAQRERVSRLVRAGTLSQSPEFMKAWASLPEADRQALLADAGR